MSANGDLLAYCDRKKLNWYVGKGLAEWVEGSEDTPPTIRLLFEHNVTDQMHGTAQFYSQSKKNMCVGCGLEEHYLKYRFAWSRPPAGSLFA